MAGRFEGKVAIVTGASGGIGRDTALAFAREGAKVVVADVLDDAGEETVALIREQGGEAIFVHTDVAQAADVEQMIARTVREYGRLDIAFNNAGIEGASAPTADCTLENWERTIGINLTGVFLCMKYELPHMLAAGGGAIVNCSSVAGVIGFAMSPAYVASKHGVIGLTKTAALEYATAGIRVNAVCPGVILTPMVQRVIEGNPQMEQGLTAMEPVGRLGTPEEISGAVLWLCSDEASFVTGHAMVVDGGMVAR